MEIEHPNAQPITLEELKDLDKLKVIVERAIADGRLSKAELETIKNAIQSDRKVTPQELDLLQHLIYSKLSSGELEMSWSSYKH